MLTKNDRIMQKNIGEGVVRKILSYSDSLMCCELKFKKGSVGELHSHPHEQIGYVISGSFEYEEEGSRVVVKAGDSYYVPPNVVHGVVALEDSVLLDIFTPKREDFI